MHGCKIMADRLNGYPLFTLVAIAGEDDLDAPEIDDDESKGRTAGRYFLLHLEGSAAGR